MIIVNGVIQLENDRGVFERTLNVRGANRKCIEMCFSGESVNYELLASTFVDGAQIVKRDVITRKVRKLVQERTETSEAVYEAVTETEDKDYLLTEYTVAGDIIDKRDGSFIVYMGKKTEAEILEEQLAETLLMVGGAL